MAVPLFFPLWASWPLHLYTCPRYLCTRFPTPFMRLIEIISHILSIFGIYSLVQHVPFLLPRNLIPHVAAVLTEVRGLVDRAEANGAITDASKYRADLTRYEAIHRLAQCPSPSLIATQFCESTPTDADRKPTFSWDISTTLTRCSVPCDVQALYALFAGRRCED